MHFLKYIGKLEIQTCSLESNFLDKNNHMNFQLYVLAYNRPFANRSNPKQLRSKFNSQSNHEQISMHRNRANLEHRNRKCNRACVHVCVSERERKGGTKYENLIKTHVSFNHKHIWMHKNRAKTRCIETEDMLQASISVQFG